MSNPKPAFYLLVIHESSSVILPDDLMAAESVDIIKDELKTNLFTQAFN